MNQIDKKVISMLLLISMLFSIIAPTITLADSKPADAIDFKNENFRLYLQYNAGVDKNADGYITPEEMKELKIANIIGYNLDNDFANVEELKYAENLEKLEMYGFKDEEFDISGFKKLKSFSICTNNSSTTKNTKIIVSDTMFAYYDNYYFKAFLPEDIELYEGERSSLVPSILGSTSNIEDENIAKFGENGLVGVKEGNTIVHLKSEFSENDMKVTVKKPDFISNQDLEKETINTKMWSFGKRVLDANGYLYEVDSTDQLTLKKKNIKDFNWIYATPSMSEDNVVLSYLDNNNKVSLEYKDAIIKEIQNVKQTIEMDAENMAYLTTNNELYFIGREQISLNKSIPAESSINPIFVDDNIENIIGNFYIKNGNTYYIENKELMENTEIKDAYRNYYALNGTLKGYFKTTMANYDSSTQTFTYTSKFNKNDNIADGFKEFKGWNNIAFPVFFKNVDDKYFTCNTTSANVTQYSNFQTKYYNNNHLFIDLFDNNYYYPDSLKLLGDVEDIFVIKEYTLIRRTDGSIWINDINKDGLEFKKLFPLNSNIKIIDESIEELPDDEPIEVLKEEVKDTIVNTEINGEQVNILPTTSDDNNIENVIENNFNVPGDGKIEITNKDGNIIEEGQKVGSYSVVTIYDSKEELLATFMIAVKGDITGNGELALFDAFKILIGTLTDPDGVNLDEFDKIIRDFNDDGNVQLFDAFKFLIKSLT